MTISLPAGHVLDIRTMDDEGSVTEVRLDGGPWTRSKIASMHKLAARWLDVGVTEIPGVWAETTGETVGHICEGCGRRRVDARVVDGSDEWWCRGCR